MGFTYLKDIHSGILSSKPITKKDAKHFYLKVEHFDILNNFLNKLD